MGRLRVLFLWLLYWSGFMWLWRFVHRHEVTILMAHGVMDTEQPTPWEPLRPQLSRRRLEVCLRALSRYYRFVSLQDAVDMLTGRKPVRPYSLVLTFDDGYRNNLTHALPILRRYKAPAAFFVTTGHIERRKPFWFDRLDYALQHAPVNGREVQVGPETLSLRAVNRAALRASYKHLRDAAKALERPDGEMVQELEDFAASLEAESGRKLAHIFEDDDWSAVLNWQEMQRAAGEDVTFGSHTVDHVRLGLVDSETVHDQLMRSKRAIEAHVGQPCDYLCYPNGSFSPQAIEIARTCGYKAAVTALEGANRVGDDPMILRRFILPDSDSNTEVLAEVCGLSLALASAATYLHLHAILPKKFGAGATG